MIRSLATSLRLLVRAMGAIALLLVLAGDAAAAPAVLLGSWEVDRDATVLVELDPATGATLRTIGPVGYGVNGMTYDPATGTLFGTTTHQSQAFKDGMITIDMTTGAGTPVGSGAGVYVNVPAAKSTSELYAWSQGPGLAIRFVQLDKTTGVASLVGYPGIPTYTHSLAFDSADTLWLLNGDGSLYTVDPATASPTLLGSVPGLPNGYAHHGSINPANGLLYALSAKDSAPTPQILAIDLATRTVVGAAPTASEIHTIAFAVLPGQVSVAKAGSGNGTVTSTDALIDCGMICNHTYVKAPTVTLNALPGPGSIFTGWLGACTGNGACVISATSIINVSATFAPNTIGNRTLDVDDSSAYDALTDGLLVIRHLFGLSAAAVASGAVAPEAPRHQPGDIQTYLNDIRPRLDVDGNGKVEALTDGLLLIRYLSGMSGDALVANVIESGATRATPALVEAYILSLMP